MIRSALTQRLATLLFSSLLGWGSAASAQTFSAFHDDASRIQVQAQAQLAVSPDMATLDARLWEHTPALAQSGGEQTDPQALNEARQRLEKRTAQLIRTLEKTGLTGEAISAGSLAVRPDYIQRPASQGETSETLVRTQLERPIRLRIDNLARLPTILDALTRAGVNALDGITYDLRDRDAATDQALTRALEQARRKAQLIADTLGVELGQVLNVQETNAPVFVPRAMAMHADARESQAAAEYRPGEIRIDAGVSMSWSIHP